MFHVNIFSLYDLAGALILLPLALRFLLSFLLNRRRRVDLVFAGLMGCAATVCVLMFLMDNVVCCGRAAGETPGAAQRTLLLARLTFTVGLLSMVVQLHFALRVVEVQHWVARQAWFIYLLCGACIPALWTDWMVTPAVAPSAAYASWVDAAPWYPQPGPLLLPYGVCWVGTQLAAVWLLFGRRGVHTRVDVSQGQVPLIRVGIVGSALGVLGDLILVSLLQWHGLSLFPMTMVLMGTVVASGLIRSQAYMERVRLQTEHEMRLAAEIQRGLLPATAPQIAGFELAGWSRSAGSTGGDVYDYVALPGGQWLLVMGDASGHGLGPALVIAETRALLRALAQRCATASEVLREVDGLLSADLEGGKFVTCFVGRLEAQAAAVHYASAGQGPILCYSRAAGVLAMHAATAPPLGITMLADSDGADACQPLQVGDLFAVASDGFFEATNRQGEQFGLARLKTALMAHAERTAAEVIAAVRAEVEAFMGDDEQRDDMTMVVLKKV